eukprot:5828166-Alexandrium_andersonii.AAC.1
MEDHTIGQRAVLPAPFMGRPVSTRPVRRLGPEELCSWELGCAGRGTRHKWLPGGLVKRPRGLERAGTRFQLAGCPP